MAFGQRFSTGSRFAHDSSTFGHLIPYVASTAAVAFSIIVRLLADPLLGQSRVAFLLPFGAVIFISIFYGLMPALFTEALSLAGVLYFILPPRFSFEVAESELEANVIAFAVGSLAFSLIGHFAFRMRSAKDELSQQVNQTFAHTATGLARCSRELKYVMVNPAYAGFIGKSAEEIVGQHLVDVLSEETMAQTLPRIDRVLGGEAVEFQAELPFFGPSGRVFNIHYAPEMDTSGEVVGWIESVEDITERKTAEVVHARLAAIVNSSGDAIISKGLDSVVTSWNHSAERLFGYSAEEMIGKSIRTVIPEDRQDEETEIIDRIGRGESIEHYETLRRRKDGSLVPISLTVSPIKDASGVIIGASKIARDITEQKLAEARIANDLTAMTRLRTIGEMSSGIDCDIELCLEAMLDAAVDFTGAAKGDIQVFQKESEVLVIELASGFGERYREYFSNVDASHDSTCGVALRRQQRVIVDDIEKSDIFIGKPGLQILLDEGIRAVQSTPLTSSTGEPLGMISTHFAETHRPGERELGLLDLLSRQAATMLERHREHTELKREALERARELNEARAALNMGGEPDEYSAAPDR